MKDRISRDFPLADIPSITEEFNNAKRRKRKVFFKLKNILIDIFNIYFWSERARSEFILSRYIHIHINA